MRVCFTKCQVGPHDEWVPTVALCWRRVGTLRDVTSPPPPEPQVFGADDLAERWGVSRQYVHEMTRGNPPLLPKGTPIGRARGRGTFAWSLAQVVAFEAANPDWVAAKPRRLAVAALRAETAARKAPGGSSPTDDATS